MTLLAPQPASVRPERRKLTPEHLAKMREARKVRQAGVFDSDRRETLSESAGSPLGAIRAKCLDCQGGSFKAVKYCSADGVHSTRCPLWPYRFGIRAPGVIRKYGKQFLTPKDMPDANTPIEELP